MTSYETVFIVHPDQAGKVKEFIDRFKKIIESLGGTVAHVEEWGLRDLSYRIQKQGRGYYVILEYRSDTRVVEELERNLKLSDGILRYLSVRQEEGAPTPPKAKAPAEEAKAREEDAAKPE